MQRRLPPFAAIRAFEAAARHLSFKAAAGEICVTPSAISHQVRVLEEFLGAELFRRDGNHIGLTAAGAAYLEELTGLLDQLDQSTRRAAGAAEARLRVLATPGFAARWLIPRLDRFADGGNVSIDVSAGAPSTDFARNEADVVIHWGDAPVVGAVVEPFMESSRYPVASPDLTAREGLRRPEDLLRMTLLHDAVMDGWANWFRAAGLAPPPMPRGPSLPHCELTLTAAENSQGVALAYDAMARGALGSGALVRLFDDATPPVTIYSIACAEARAAEPRIDAFRNWLFEEVIAEGSLAANAPGAARVRVRPPAA